LKPIDLGERVAMLPTIARIATLLTTIAASSAALAGPAYLGDWARADGKTRIHVAACGASVCARNTWVRHGVSGEKVGDRLVLKVKPSGAGRWSGSAFDPQRGQNYAITVRAAAKHMTTRGCVMAGFVCESMNWSR
jgi:uncharacterized protein (DUF2147 family)